MEYFHSFYTITPTSELHAQVKYTEAEYCTQMEEDIAAAKTVFNEVMSKSFADAWTECAQRHLLLRGTGENKTQ